MEFRFNELANKLIADGHSDTPRIRERQGAIAAQWQALQDALTARSESLVTSGDVAQVMATPLYARGRRPFTCRQNCR